MKTEINEFNNPYFKECKKELLTIKKERNKKTKSLLKENLRNSVSSYSRNEYITFDQWKNINDSLNQI